MSVTAKSLYASNTVTRNEAILRYVEERVERDLTSPYRESIETVFYGRRLPDDEVREKATERALERAAHRCDGWRSDLRQPCNHVFEVGETVARYRRGYGGRWELITRCAECEPLSVSDASTAVECEGGCGLLIVSLFCRDPRRWIRSPYRTCSKRCSETVARRRAHVEHEPRPCEECGETFSPTRADARYCSPAHKQKAYRRRKAAEA